jgi:TctA family transporter
VPRAGRAGRFEPRDGFPIRYFSISVGGGRAPLLLAPVPGPQPKENFRCAMQLSNGKHSLFIIHPISIMLLGIAA